MVWSILLFTLMVCSFTIIVLTTLLWIDQKIWRWRIGKQLNKLD
jgi:hypothetical protein